MPNNALPVVGIIGAGRLGTSLARLIVNAGYSVKIANSRAPQTLKLILKVLLPGVNPATVTELSDSCELIVLALPLGKSLSLNAELFVGKTIIDAMNYWPTTEGTITLLEGTISSSEIIQRHFSHSVVIKTLNHVAYNELEEDAVLVGDPKRRAIALAGPTGDSKNTVMALINAIGFDPVDFGGLEEGIKFGPDTQLFNARYTAAQMRAM